MEPTSSRTRQSESYRSYLRHNPAAKDPACRIWGTNQPIVWRAGYEAALEDFWHARGLTEEHPTGTKTQEPQAEEIARLNKLVLNYGLLIDILGQAGIRVSYATDGSGTLISIRVPEDIQAGDRFDVDGLIPKGTRNIDGVRIRDEDLPRPGATFTVIPPTKPAEIRWPPAGKLQNAQADVRQFMEEVHEMTVPTGPSIQSEGILSLATALLREELQETLAALVLTRARNRTAAESLAALADGLVDLIYVALWTANAYGIDMEPVWAEAQTTNMAKKGGPRDLQTGKQLKPEGWRPPDFLKIIAQQIAASAHHGS